MILKIIALGFLIDQGTYIRNGWNLLDFVIVITAWVPYLMTLMDIEASGSSSGLRAFRMLRPLRSINRLPSMKKLVESILLALPQATVLLLLVALFFLVYGIIGIQLFQEAQPLQGTVSFDSLPNAMMVVLPMVTRKSWQSLMMKTQAAGDVAAIIYFVSGVMLGSYLIMNLFVAVINDKFQIVHLVSETGETAFAAIDEDGGGDLDRNEIGKIFVLYGVYLTDKELDACVDEIDVDGSGEIDVHEFLTWLRGSTHLAAKLRNELQTAEIATDGAVDGDYIAATKRSLREFNQGMSRDQLFSFYDRDGDGELSLAEFRTAIRRDARISKYILPDGAFSFTRPHHASTVSVYHLTVSLRRSATRIPDDLKAMFETIDGDGGGEVDVGEFIEWLQTDEAAWSANVAAEQLKVDQARVLLSLRLARSILYMESL
jgi:Ca2+-binding EF-hand superfamily protein